MKSEAVFDAIGKADDRYIEEAAPGGKKIKKYAWVKWGAVAACLALAIYAGIRFIPTENPEPGTTVRTQDQGAPGPDDTAGPDDSGTADPGIPEENLPVLTIPPESGSMGFEACMAYDISELDNGNPWTADAQLDTMPVYKNTAYDSAGAAVSGIGQEQMLDLAGQTADALGMEISGVTYETAGDQSKEGGDNGTVVGVDAATAEAVIRVTQDGVVTVSFTSGIELPGQYSFTYADTSDAQAESVTDYLIKKYAGFVSFSQPQKALFADYTFDGNRNRSYYAYDMAGGIAQQIMNFNFNKVQFAPDDNGNLMLIRKYNGLSCAEKIGDYPIVTSEEAEGLLRGGNYITSVPEEMPGEDYIAKAELVYKTAANNETFLPYYRFWVELPDMQQENGLITYGAYYVPAVEQQYLSNMPVWDGSFN